MLAPVITSCRAPGTSISAARARLAAVEARGVPCYRCLANLADRGRPARCGFLESARTGFGADRPAIPAPDPDGFGL